MVSDKLIKEIKYEDNNFEEIASVAHALNSYFII
jgi:hypothetical protein